MLKWILVGLGVIAALILGMTIAGSMMPENHVVSISATLHQPREAVWEAISNFEQSPGWRSDLTEVRRSDDRNGHEVWLEVGDFGEQPLEVTESIPNQKLVLRIADDSLPYGGTWTLELAPVGDGTEITVTEDGFVKPALLRFMSRKLLGEDVTIRSYLTDLFRKFGEEPPF